MPLVQHYILTCQNGTFIAQTVIHHNRKKKRKRNHESKEQCGWLLSLDFDYLTKVTIVLWYCHRKKKKKKYELPTFIDKVLFPNRNRTVRQVCDKFWCGAHALWMALCPRFFPFDARGSLSYSCNSFTTGIISYKTNFYYFLPTALSCSFIIKKSIKMCATRQVKQIRID